MIRYDLKRLAQEKRKRSGKVILPPIADRLGTRRAYLAELRRMLAGIAAETRASVIPAYRFEQSRLTRDVDESTFNSVRATAVLLARLAADTVNRILGLESQRHTENFREIARKALGIDLSAVVQQEDLEDYLRQAAARNTSLIKSLSDEVVKRIEQSVLRNGIAGNSVKALQSELTDQFGVLDSRARLIARDQSSKFASDLNRVRQEQAGIEGYKWSTSHDERVRPLHKGLDGNEYSWGQRTGAEDGLPPGQPIQCRCVARAVLDFG